MPFLVSPVLGPAGSPKVCRHTEVKRVTVSWWAHRWPKNGFRNPIIVSVFFFLQEVVVVSDLGDHFTFQKSICLSQYFLQTSETLE